MQERPYHPNEPAPRPPAPPPGGWVGVPGGSRPTNALAIVSLATGAASFVFLPLVGAIVAVVTGHMARRDIRRTGEGGSGLAVAGLILGYVHLALFVLAIGVVILIFAGVLAGVFGQR